MNDNIEICTEKATVNKTGLIFAILWFASFMWFFVAQIIVAGAWENPPYNWREQNVSDLGQFGYPLSILMNIAFFLQGAAMAVGVWLIKIIWHKIFLPSIARTMLALSGVGFIIVGLTPYNVIPIIHSIFGAFPVMLFSSAGLILAGLAKSRENFGSFWVVTIVIGLVCLASGLLFFTGHDGLIGRGAMERIWIYAPLVWTLIISCRVIHLYRCPPN